MKRITVYVNAETLMEAMDTVESGGNVQWEASDGTTVELVAAPEND